VAYTRLDRLLRVYRISLFPAARIAENYVINNPQQSPSSEADSHSAIQEIPHLLWNPKLHYRVHKGQLLVPIMSQMNSVQTFSSISLRSVLILSSHLRLGLPNGPFFPSGLPTKMLYALVISPRSATCLVHLILLNLITIFV